MDTPDPFPTSPPRLVRALVGWGLAGLALWQGGASLGILARRAGPLVRQVARADLSLAPEERIEAVLRKDGGLYRFLVEALPETGTLYVIGNPQATDRSLWIVLFPLRVRDLEAWPPESLDAGLPDPVFLLAPGAAPLEAHRALGSWGEHRLYEMVER